MFTSEKNKHTLADFSKNKGESNTMNIKYKREIYFEP